MRRRIACSPLSPSDCRSRGAQWPPRGDGGGWLHSPSLSALASTSGTNCSPHELREFDEKLKAKIEKWVSKEKHGNLKYRLQAATSGRQEDGVLLRQPTGSRRSTSLLGLRAGHILLVTLPELFNSFMQGDKRMIEVTEGASKLAEQAVQQHVHPLPGLPALRSRSCAVDGLQGGRSCRSHRSWPRLVGADAAP
jgi:hypothetical protein